MSESIQNNINPVRHGFILAVLALIFGALWAAFLAVNHERLHSGFEKQEHAIQQEQMKRSMLDMNMDAMKLDQAHASEAAHPHEEGQDQHAHATKNQHVHTGSLASDAMQRLLRGHIHFMGLGVLVSALLLITAFTSLKSCWKKVFGWTFGLGALAYPPAWILMGFRTVRLGPEAAEQSVMWLFGPSAGLLLVSLFAVLGTLAIEACKLQKRTRMLACFFDREDSAS